VGDGGGRRRGSARHGRAGGRALNRVEALGVPRRGAVHEDRRRRLQRRRPRPPRAARVARHHRIPGLQPRRRRRRRQPDDWRLSHEKPREDCDEAELDPTYRESVKCKIFLGFTSNLVSSGIRDVVRFLVQHHMVDVIVTTAGGIEEDLIKCLAPTYRGEFSLPGTLLRSKGLNRIGNLLVPNDNYCKFENWIMPLFDQMLQEQSTEVLLHFSSG
jgi:hypothetical protein